ncbi:MAG TPA: O-antigen ligase family protein [Pyrinomonadaceae bacterium]
MSVKDPSLDYEPLRRTPSKSAKEEDAEEFSFKRSTTAATVDEQWTHTKSAATESQESVLIRQPGAEIPRVNETWIHKHGHSLSYAGIFLFTAFVFFRPYEWSPSLFWLRSAAFWIALATTIVFVLTQLGLENTITARPREVNLVLLLTLTGLLSIPLALEPGKAWESFLEFLKVVLIFIVMINVVRTQKRLKLLWLLVLVATCILSINAIQDYRSGILALRGMRIKGSIGGLFDNPNDLALHLVTVFPIALALLFSSRNVVTKIACVLTSLLTVGGIVVTFSRGGFLALLAASLLLLWKLARKSRGLVVPVAAALMVAFVVFAPGGYKQRISTTGDESSIARFDDLKRSLYVALRHPVFGVGMDNYILFSNTNKASHNAYTQVAAEMGAAAAVFYILFIIAPFKGLRRVEYQTYDDPSARRFFYMSIGLQASLIGYMVASFFASVAFLWYIYYLVAYAVCLRRIYDSTLDGETAPGNPSPT